MARLAAETRARDPRRPVIQGEALPGNAWADYGEALGAMNTLRGESEAIAAFARGAEWPSRGRVRELLRTHAGLLECLRRGARREEGAYPYDWTGSPDVETPDHCSAWRLVEFAAGRARLLMEEGRSTDAIPLLMDTCQFARDLTQNGGLVAAAHGTGLFQRPIVILRELVAQGSMEKEDFLEIDRCLRVFDAGLPDRRQFWSNQTANYGTALLSTDRLGEVAWAPGWRHLFSPGVADVDAFEWIDRAGALASRWPGMSWADVEESAARFLDRAEARGCPIGRRYLRETLGSDQESSWRVIVANLRMIRMAARYRATGEFLKLEDPFGESLLHARSGDSVRLWSLGENGRDDGGKGELWAGEDLVLEVPR